MSLTTVELLNQSAALVDYNLFSSHSALVDALAREGAAAEHDALLALGERLGSVTLFTLGDVANRNPPQHEEEAALLRRVSTPAVKYWICKRAPSVCAETMQVLEALVARVLAP